MISSCHRKTPKSRSLLMLGNINRLTVLISGLLLVLLVVLERTYPDLRSENTKLRDEAPWAHVASVRPPARYYHGTRLVPV